MDYDSLAKAGSMLGSGGVVVIDEDTCMVDVARRIMHFYAHESCGWCIPCREGTGWLGKMLDRFHSVAAGPKTFPWSANWQRICSARRLPARRRRPHAHDQYRKKWAHEFEQHLRASAPISRPPIGHGALRIPVQMADSKDITLKIDDRDVTVPPGTLVIEAARRMESRFRRSATSWLSLQAACRMCLVEVEKAPKLQTACTLVAMRGWLCAPARNRFIRRARRCSNFCLPITLDCPVCDKAASANCKTWFYLRRG